MRMRRKQGKEGRMNTEARCADRKRTTESRKRRVWKEERSKGNGEVQRRRKE
jgi:hypothetical protein